MQKYESSDQENDTQEAECKSTIVRGGGERCILNFIKVDLF